MTETFRLNTSGPHSDAHTIQAADALTTAVRVLNHATLSQDGVTDPATVYTVLGQVMAAVAGLDQLLGQLGDNLTRLDAARRLGHDDGHPAEALAVALRHLDEGRPVARELNADIYAAHAATSGMHLRTEGDAR